MRSPGLILRGNPVSFPMVYHEQGEWEGEHKYKAELQYCATNGFCNVTNCIVDHRSSKRRNVHYVLSSHMYDLCNYFGLRLGCNTVGKMRLFGTILPSNHQA